MNDKKNEDKLNIIKEKIEDCENERIIPLYPKRKTTLAEWKEIITDNFSELVTPAEIGLSVIAQLLITDIKNPFALVYVDVPSSGKTICLNFFSTIKELIYTTDNFTPASFVSHSAKTTKKNLAKNDMLPKIKNRVLAIRDLATIFAKRDEDVQEMLGVFIRVLDGEGLETNSGLHGKRGYSGDYLFMLLSASTPFRPRIWKVMGNLGSRLFFLNINCKEKNEVILVGQLKKSCRDKEIICREVTSEFIKTLWNKHPNGISWDTENDDEKSMIFIARFSKILAKLRSAINVWEENFGTKKYNHTQPITEMPDRLNQLLYNLSRGHALICDRHSINFEDLAIVLKVVLDSFSPNRSKIFKFLLKNGGRIGTNQVIKILNCSRPTALKLMKELSLLEIVDSQDDLEDESDANIGRPEQEIELRESYKWLLGEECQKLLTNSGRNS